MNKPTEKRDSCTKNNLAEIYVLIIESAIAYTIVYICISLYRKRSRKQTTQEKLYKRNSTSTCAGLLYGYTHRSREHFSIINGV